MVFIWIPPSKAPKEEAIKNIEKSITKISQDFSVLKLLYFCQIKVQIEIINIILFAKSGCCVDCKGPCLEMANFKFIAKQFSLSAEGYFEFCHWIEKS